MHRIRQIDLNYFVVCILLILWPLLVYTCQRQSQIERSKSLEYSPRFYICLSTVCMWLMNKLKRYIYYFEKFRKLRMESLPHYRVGSDKLIRGKNLSSIHNNTVNSLSFLLLYTITEHFSLNQINNTYPFASFLLN